MVIPPPEGTGPPPSSTPHCQSGSEAVALHISLPPGPPPGPGHQCPSPMAATAASQVLLLRPPLTFSASSAQLPDPVTPLHLCICHSSNNCPAHSQSQTPQHCGRYLARDLSCPITWDSTPFTSQTLLACLSPRSPFVVNGLLLSLDAQHPGVNLAQPLTFLAQRSPSQWS